MVLTRRLVDDTLALIYLASQMLPSASTQAIVLDPATKKTNIGSHFGNHFRFLLVIFSTLSEPTNDSENL